MRSRFTKGTFILAPVLIVVGTFSTAVVAAPRILVEKPSRDFGCVTNTTHLLHDFIVRNIGDANLEITRVATSCDSCLNVVLDENTIAPGGVTTAHCSLDTRSLNGALFRVITVESNDPLSEALQLEFLATIVPAYRLSPLELTIGGAVDQRKSVVDILPLLKMNEPLSVVECDNTNIVAGVFETESGQYQLVAQALASLPRGRSVFTSVVRSLNSNDPPCTIVGRIDFPQDLEIIPAQLTFEASDEPQTRILWLRQHGEMAFSLLDAVPSSGLFHCEIEPDPTSANYRVYVEATKLAVLKGQPFKITLKGVTQQQQEVVLSVEILVN